MKNKIIEKIKKCFALSKSSNEHEAASALRHARMLMEKYGISDTEMIMAGVSEADAKAGATEKPPFWEAKLAGVVSKAFNCEMIFSRDPWNGYWRFIGCGISPTIAEFAFSVLITQAKRARREFIKTIHRNSKASTKTARADLFCMGWVNSVSRLVGTFAGSSEKDKKAIETFMQNKYPKLGKLPTSGRHHLSKKENDYEAGQAAGKNARLNNGVSANGQAALN